MGRGKLTFTIGRTSPGLRARAPACARARIHPERRGMGRGKLTFTIGRTSPGLRARAPACAPARIPFFGIAKAMPKKLKARTR